MEARRGRNLKRYDGSFRKLERAGQRLLTKVGCCSYKNNLLGATPRVVVDSGR
jgi:hypothetical protein